MADLQRKQKIFAEIEGTYGTDAIWANARMVAGTVAVTQGAKTVTGTSTTFVTHSYQSGDRIIINGETRYVDEVASETALTVTENITQTSDTGLSYTASGPDADMALQVFNVAFTPNVNVLERPILVDTLSGEEPTVVIGSGVLSFDMELKGNGSIQDGDSGSAVELDRVLRACGMSPTYTPESGGGNGDGYVIYAPVSEDQESITIHHHHNGVLHTLTGCRGTFSNDMNANEIPVVHFTFTGLYVQPVNATMCGLASALTTKPVPVNAASFAIGGYSAVVSQLSLDLANTIAEDPSINATNGIAEVIISGREPKGTMDPQHVSIGTADFWDWLTDGTYKALTLTIGSVAGNKVTPAAPRCVFESLSHADRNGVAAYNLGFGLRKASAAGNDEFTLKFF